MHRARDGGDREDVRIVSDTAKTFHAHDETELNPSLPCRGLSDAMRHPVAYSFCSLVTDLSEYESMVRAFVEKGFTSADCEFVYADNSLGNRFEAFSAYNRFLLEARGRYLVLCHQDILPLVHDRDHLDRVLEELTSKDPHWGLAGNGGATADGEFVYRLTQGGQGPVDQGGPYPREVMSLDENFIVVRRDANLALSRDLSGFHWYGADLSAVARVLGWRAYVIDFELLHKSGGKIDADFIEKATLFREKYARAFSPRWHHVPTQRSVYISASRTRTFLFRSLRWARRKIAGRTAVGRPK